MPGDWAIQKMRVLLTGSTGFIGSHVARLLVGQGCDVHALVRERSDLARISDIVPLLHLVRGDLLACDGLQMKLERVRPEICIHLAWYTVPGKYLTARENVRLLDASVNLASRLADLGCRRFVGMGTCLEYDLSAGYLSEDSPVKPSTLYGACKLAVQMVLEQLARTTGMEVAWLRLFYLYGPWEDERRLVPFVISSLLRDEVAKVTNGQQLRDYLHVEDVARAAWAVACSNLCGPVNLGSGAPVAVRDIVTRIGAVLGRPDLLAIGAVPSSVSEPMFICADNRRLTERTSWRPEYDLDQGLRHTVDWWRRRSSAKCELKPTLRGSPA